MNLKPQDVAEAVHKKAVARSQSMAQRQHLDTQVTPKPSPLNPNH
jgi:hypothetical protein